MTVAVPGPTALPVCWRGAAGEAQRGAEQSRAGRSSPRARELGWGLWSTFYSEIATEEWTTEERHDLTGLVLFFFLINTYLAVPGLSRSTQGLFNCECGIFSGSMGALVP